MQEPFQVLARLGMPYVQEQRDLWKSITATEHLYFSRREGVEGRFHSLGNHHDPL